MKLAAECPAKKNRSEVIERGSDERRAKDGSGSSHTEETGKWGGRRREGVEGEKQGRRKQ